MSATADAEAKSQSRLNGPDFETALHLRDRGGDVPALPEEVVAPIIDLEQAKRIWNSHFELKALLLGDDDCFDVIDGSKEMNRTGATRLALAFGLSIEMVDIDEGRVQLDDSGTFDYRYRVRVRVSKGSRHVDGIGSCRLGEITDKMSPSKREHFALTRAWTRGSKRAIADILGGTEAE